MRFQARGAAGRDRVSLPARAPVAEPLPALPAGTFSSAGDRGLTGAARALVRGQSSAIEDPARRRRILINHSNSSCNN